MPRSGAPATYISNGAWPSPPDFGWRKASVNTDHGRLLLQYLNSGRVKLTDPPTRIWTNHIDLRVVNPQTKAFHKFVGRCKQAYKKQQTFESESSPKMPTDASYRSAGNYDSDDDDDDDNFRPPDPPHQMPRPRNALTDVPLMHPQDYATRDQQISLPTRIFSSKPCLLLFLLLLLLLLLSPIIY